MTTKTFITICLFGLLAPSSHAQQNSAEFISVCSMEEEENGHVWIVDEYRRVYTVDTYYYDEPPYDIYYEDSSSHEYFHCNWGYGEESPSAYCLNVFEDPNGASFNRNKTIIYDILPDNQ